MNRKWTYLLLVIVLLLIVLTGEKPTAMAYWPSVTSIMASEFQDIEQYGSLYIDRSKYVLALAKQDEKTDRLQAKLRETVPPHLLVINTDYKYSVAELKKVQDELYNRRLDIVASYVDDALDKVVIEAQSMTEETQNSLIRSYGDRIEIRIDPTMQKPLPTEGA